MNADVTCVRCGRACEPVRVDELTTHYRCPAEDCPHPGLYQGEHPLYFWTMFALEVSIKAARTPYALARWAWWRLKRRQR